MTKTINTLTQIEIDTLTALVENGPLLVTELPNKHAAGVLMVHRWAAHITIKGEHRYAATYEGERLYCAYYDGGTFQLAQANRQSGNYGKSESTG
jgi:hypothetical protein